MDTRIERERERERYAWTVVVSIFFLPPRLLHHFDIHVASSFPSSFVHGLNRLSSSLWEDNDRGEFYFIPEFYFIRNVRNQRVDVDCRLIFRQKRNKKLDSNLFSILYLSISVNRQNKIESKVQFLFYFFFFPFSKLDTISRLIETMHKSILLFLPFLTIS